ncbi:hypothetical protein ACFOY8_21115 [Thalassospira xianhensis]|uniref:Permuted papain-like amidase YaeF/Yiix C92 family enzyme n=1 Tax=Thalassospira xianhensis MCCC 1A02616 TaxID=1177929 RepID=A0A367UFU1_9PROT|nr:hypothetical protein [Thalassospira xianhensis]RCK07175.1 hypothetical protein TH5_04350 [Thalassospira xianhensis MCCC 1A02616]
MRKLDETVMEPCDIVLTSDSGFTSRVVRKHTDSDISHAMLYVQNHALIDSTGDGVHTSNTQRNLFTDDCTLYVLRPRTPLSNAQKISILTYARAQTGTSYATFQAAAVTRLNPLKPSTTKSKKQFCSRLVAQAYAKAGINLIENPDYCSPDDLKTSSLLEFVPTAIRTATEEEINFAKKSSDTTALMRETTNDLLKSARQKSTKIETPNDIDEHLFQNPSDDQYMTDALKLSGYLDIWRHDCIKNPWHYDLDLMMKRKNINKTHEYCIIITSYRDLDDRYLINRGVYCTYYKSRDLEYFKEMFELYDLLLELDRTRLEVAKAWLAHHHGTENDEHILEPHSTDWFELMDKWDPVTAQQIRYVVQQVSTTEVCGICGDTPAEDYRLAPEQRPKGGIDTYRLCDDCLDIRSRLHGENYAPMNET